MCFARSAATTAQPQPWSSLTSVAAHFAKRSFTNVVWQIYVSIGWWTHLQLVPLAVHAAVHRIRGDGGRLRHLVPGPRLPHSGGAQPAPDGEAHWQGAPWQASHIQVDARSSGGKERSKNDQRLVCRLNTEVSMDAARTWCPSAGCDTICHICAGTKSQVTLEFDAIGRDGHRIHQV